MITTIYLEDIAKAPHLVYITYRYQSYRFEVSLWYDIDLEEVEKKYGKAFMDCIYFHIAAFEINMLTSLAPTYIDFGKYAPWVTQQFWEIWLNIQRKVWAQWRFENDMPHYEPKLAHDFSQNPQEKQLIQSGNTEVLAFFGGGKDSLVAARLLEELKIPYSSFVYAHSIYGKMENQFTLINALLATLSPQKVHRQYIFDSFMDSPILKVEKQISTKTLTAAETPSSIFACLPIVLAEGYQYIILAHEHSANTGNFIWEKTGEEVNHQWGKSNEAENLLNTYIQQQLLPNFSYFSLLQPIHDVFIFYLLSQNVENIPLTHSCNIQKPWCKKCPKCVYVWLNYMAYLPIDMVNQMFGDTNLLTVPENQKAFQEMLGFGEHTPFECIGQIEESRLALHLCYLKGIRGEAMRWHEILRQENTDFSKIAEKFTHVHAAENMPLPFKDKIYPYLFSIQKEANSFFQQVLH